MGRIPAITLVIIVIWVASTFYREGPENAFGGLFALLSSPQYGEMDRPTRSGRLADEVEAVPQGEEPNRNWWARP